MTTPLRKPKRNQTNKLGGEREQAKAGSGSKEEPEASADTTDNDGGNGDGIHDLDPEEGELFKVDPADVSPNPMNRRRSLRKMDDLIASVARQGIHTPGAVMHTKLFAEKYPEWADKIENPRATYILGPGHRRRLAALKAGKPMLAILRNSWAKQHTVEENLISENKERDDLSAIEQALQLDLLRQRDMTGEEIAERFGYKSRGTVSRILALLVLPEEIQDAVHADFEKRADLADLSAQDDQEAEGAEATAVFSISAKAGYVLSTIKDSDGRNSTEAAHELQLRAFGWMRDEGLSAEAARNRLSFAAFTADTAAAAPQSAEAAPQGTDTGAPTADVSRGKHDGSGAEDGQGSEDEGPLDDGSPDEERDSSDGAGGGPEASIPHQADGTEGASESGATTDPETPAPDPAAVAAEGRDFACRLLLDEEKYVGNVEITSHLISSVLNPDEWRTAAARAHTWLRDLGKGPEQTRPKEYMADVAASGDANLMRRVAFAIALAANEVRAAKPGREWDERDRAHVRFLTTSKAAYQPTPWEQERLAPVSTATQ